MSERQNRALGASRRIPVGPSCATNVHGWNGACWSFTLDAP
jgi:hypothetical protein